MPAASGSASPTSRACAAGRAGASPWCSSSSTWWRGCPRSTTCSPAGPAPAAGGPGGRARGRIAVVSRQFNLVARLSALNNVLAGRLGHVAAWRGWTRRFERADRLLALECLDRVGLLELAAQRADTLSGGQQQRVA